jgi:hypothetical protein
MGNTASSNPLNNTFNKLAGFKKPDTCSPNNDGIFEIYRIWTTLIPTLIGIVILELLIIMFNTRGSLGTSTSITGAFKLPDGMRMK